MYFFFSANPFAPCYFAENRLLKLVEQFSGYKEPIKNYPKRHLYFGHSVHGLLFQNQNISFQRSGMHRKQNLKIVFGLKSVVAVLTFTSRFLAYLGRLLGFISVDKVV